MCLADTETKSSERFIANVDQPGNYLIGDFCQSFLWGRSVRLKQYHGPSRLVVMVTFIGNSR